MIDIEFIARAEERSDFTRINRHVFERFSNKNDDSNIDDRRSDFWLNDEVSDSTLAQIRCFLDDLDLIWWLNRIIFVTLCQSSEANLNQRSRRILFVNLDYRVDSSVLSVKRRRRTSLLCFVSAYIHNELIVVCFDALFEWSSDTSLLCFIITELYWKQNALFI